MDKLVNIRKKVQEALALGLLSDEDSKNFYESTLIQIMNDSEAQRQRCLRLADDARKHALKAEAEAHAYSQMSSVINGILNGYIDAAQRALNEVKEDKEEIIATKKPRKRNK